MANNGIVFMTITACLSLNNLFFKKNIGEVVDIHLTISLTH